MRDQHRDSKNTYCRDNAIAVNGQRLLRELSFPATDSAVLTAIVTFALLALLAQHAGLLGLWLGVILLPAVFRYLLMLLEARALGRATPVAGIELFNIADNLWSFAPLVLVAVAVWGGILLDRSVSPVAAGALWLLMAVALPASLAILAISRSPLASLNPHGMAQVVGACGPWYALAPASLLAAVLLIDLSGSGGLLGIAAMGAGWYALFLLFTMTGSLCAAGKLEFAASIPDPVEPDEAVLDERQKQARRRVLTHAYGLFSRQNRAGGIAHIRQALREEADDDGAWRWYIGEMFAWESKDPALMLAREYLPRLLAAGRDVEAVKLLARCLLQDGSFRPGAEDRDEIRELLQRHRRADLMSALDL